MPQKSHFSQSLEHRLYTAEFDDALVDAAHWKNPRYAGSKLTGLRINEYHGIDPTIDKINTSSAEYLGQRVIVEGNTNTVWGGDISYGLNPVINKETTAIYIANTVIGGAEKPKRYATLEGHSYVGVNKILVVNKEDNTVKVIDRETEPYDSFHRFITQDFPTGAKLNIKILDEAIQSDLEGDYNVRMNKGFLLSTFKYFDYQLANYTGSSGTTIYSDPQTTVPAQSYQRPLELFDQSDMGDSGGASTSFDSVVAIDTPRLSFRLGIKTSDPAGFAYPAGGSLAGLIKLSPTANADGVMVKRDFSPSYVSASIETNKFTKQYYTGSNTFPNINTGYNGAFFSASRFIINDTLGFLQKNFETTELHLTINKGTLDFAPGFNDERSMGTFEVDKGYGSLAGFGNSDVTLNDETDGSDGTGAGGLNTFDGLGNPGGFIGHNTPNHPIIQLKGTPPFTPIGAPPTTGRDIVALYDFSTDSGAAKLNHQRRVYWNGNENPRVLNYSGSAAYELSFLDKDHTLIVNIDKPTELFEGIGTLGMALIPEHLHPTIKSNLEYYLKQGGILTKSTTFQSKR